MRTPLQILAVEDEKAVAQIGQFRFSGFLAWLLWGGIHIAFLVGFRNRLQVLLNWFWAWLLNARDARLITGDARLEIQSPPPEFIRDHIPGAKFAVLDTAHIANMELPQAYADTVLGFLLN